MSAGLAQDLGMVQAGQISILKSGKEVPALQIR
jgi:hypothetical protein